MSNATAGAFDRRIEVYRATETKDRAGDPIPSWALAFKRWACRRGDSQTKGDETIAAQQVVRQADMIWALRDDSESRLIAAETHRIEYRGAVYEIVGITEGTGARFDTLEFLCSSRPDLRGDRGRNNPSGQP